MTDLSQHDCWLTLDIIGDGAYLPLTRDEFDDLAKGRAALVEGLGLEERLALVLENYVEYEGTLLRGALESLVFAHTSWSDFTGVIHTVNRRLVNVLSSCRGYIDQVCHFASGYFGKSSKELEEIRSWLSEQYDGLLGYRTMEALRNYSQHRGMAVHHLSSPSWWDKERERSRCSLVPSLVPKRLADDGDFKKSVLHRTCCDPHRRRADVGRKGEHFLRFDHKAAAPQPPAPNAQETLDALRDK